MTPQEVIDHLRALEGKATPGPWVAERNRNGDAYVSGPLWPGGEGMRGTLDRKSKLRYRAYRLLADRILKLSSLDVDVGLEAENFAADIMRAIGARRGVVEKLVADLEEAEACEREWEGKS